MDLLLDTCTFLWICSNDNRLSTKARELFVDPANNVFLSSVSTWEISVKHALGRLPFPEPPAQLIPSWRIQHKIESFALGEEATFHITLLPKIHKDPFDRMLICQALVSGKSILTPDEAIRQYPVRTIW